MALDADQIRIARFGRIHLGPVGETVPDDPTEALGSGFTELGLVTEDGVTFNQNPSVEEIRSWQKANPTKRFVTGRDAVVSFVLQQTNPANVEFAFGGGTVSEVEPGIYQYDPPADTEDLGEWCLVVDTQDGDIHDRYEIYRGSVMEGVEQTFQRTAPSLLPVTFSALTPDELDRPWRRISDDPAMDPAAS